MCVFKYLKTCHGEDGAELFRAVPEDRTRNDKFTLKENRFGLDTRKNFLVVQQWN